MVKPGSTGDARTIQAGLDSASVGDTVLVWAGTYYETGIHLKSGVYLTSQTGYADCVTIDGEGFNGRILYSTDDDSTTHIVGFTITGGYAFDDQAGAMLIWESDLRIINCSFRYNTADGYGGAVVIARNRPVFTNCEFEGNRATLYDPYNYECDGGACYCYQGIPTFRDCRFSGNSASRDGGAFMGFWGCHATFERCLFAGNRSDGTIGGGAMALSGKSSASLSQCSFIGNEARWPGYGGGILCMDSSSVTLVRCIIAYSERGEALAWNGPGIEPSLTCCDLYGNEGGDWTGVIAGQYGVNGNISDDPLFCDLMGGDFYLCETSPCAVEGPCFHIGVYGVGCWQDTVAWEDVTTETLDDHSTGRGLAWVDYDNDGDLDIFHTNDSVYPDKLYRNVDLTAESFVDATPSTLADVGDCRGAAWGDYDNDGDLDLYVSRNGANRLYRNDGGGKFVDVTQKPLDDSGIGQTVSWADYDNDGDVDLYLVNNGANKLFRNDGGGVFTDVTSGPLGDGGFGLGCGWADFDDDGDLDIYVANYDGANVLLENQGGVFVDATTPVLEITAASAGVAWGDFDNDCDLDLYVTNEGPNTLLRNDGGVFTDVTSSPLDDGGNGRSAAWADYDLDGDLDLYVVNYDSNNRLFRNEGAGSFTSRAGCGSSPVSVGLPTLSAGWADYDKDGDPDLYLVNHGPNRLFRNDLDEACRWLEVQLEGVISNTYGQGARVRLVTGGTSQMREIAGASGYLSQGPLVAAFGLGLNEVVDAVEVTWPASGYIQTIFDVPADQCMKVVESDVSGVDGGGGGCDNPVLTVQLHPSRPNPFRTATLIRYDLPKTMHVDLEIYDVSGRLIRRLLKWGPMGPGSHTSIWNGRDDEGRVVASGVYFCELTAGSHSQRQRIVLLK